MAAQKIIVDPVTRIEGHLKLEVEVDNGVVVDAKCGGTLFRGFELILQGRDPRMPNKSCRGSAAYAQLDMQLLESWLLMTLLELNLRPMAELLET